MLKYEDFDANLFFRVTVLLPSNVKLQIFKCLYAITGQKRAAESWN